MKLEFKDVQPNSYITLVNIGYTKSSYGDNWYDWEPVTGKTDFFKVEKKGKKYLHGYYVYFSDEGKEVVSSFMSYIDVSKTKQLIFSGLRRDMEQKYREYEKAQREHDKKEQNACYEIDRYTRDLNYKMREEWREKNPSPNAPKIDTYQ